MLTCHHYLLKSDGDGFFRNTLLEHAVKNEALLFAVAAFSSFHYSVLYTTGAFQTFLEYYNKAVALLRVSLDQEHSIDTVLTILQLACFEVVGPFSITVLFFWATYLIRTRDNCRSTWVIGPVLWSTAMLRQR